MGEFRVYAKIGGLIPGETPEDAQKQAHRILTHLLEPKGFEVVGVAAVAGDRIPGRLATVETDESVHAVEGGAGAANVLRWLGQHVFSEGVHLSTQRVKSAGGIKLRQYPLSVELGHPDSIDYIEATGSISEVPPDFYVHVPAKKVAAKKADEPKADPNALEPEIELGDKPEAPIASEPDTEHKMQIPQGEFGYGWDLLTIFDPETAAFADKTEKRLTSEMERVIKLQLHGTPQKIKGRRSVVFQDVDAETGNLKLSVRGLFTSPIDPEKINHALSEKIGIRSILPKEVAETDTTSAKPVAEKNDLSALLGSLIQ